ncbi:MAG: hypothetical protein GOV00_02445 [Candidatus Altiarchaeota archaeon]|nr:hypothetical protein [Candidatus Altiarchaeota archaeon]
METFLVILLFSTLVTVLITKWLKSYFFSSEIVGEDVHKQRKPILPTSGGVPVFLGFFFSVMLYSFLITYLLNATDALLEILAGVLSIAIITLIGFLDDVNVKGSIRRGLKQWEKPLLSLPAALPLMAVKLGTSIVTLPFIGAVEFGLVYPLILIPLGVMISANMVNMLAGMNGLEAGAPLIYFTSLTAFVYFNSTSLAAKVIAFSALGAIIGFFPFNKVPAKMLTGDSFTYFMGAVLVSVAVIGNVEKATLILSVPFLIEFLLKARGKFKIPTLGKLENGKIVKQTPGIYSIPHIWMNGKYTEYQIVKRVWAVFAVFATLSWFL